MKTYLKRAADRLLRPLFSRREALRRRLGAMRRRLRGSRGKLPRIEPVFVARDRQEFEQASARAHLSDVFPPDAQGRPRRKDVAYDLRRFCLCCNATTSMRVDFAASYRQEDGLPLPNWRETLVCRECGMNNRQRLVARLLEQAAAGFARPRIYLMEQVTPIFAWAKSLPGAEVHGSEYLGYQYRGGHTVGGIRHEDVMDLSWPDASLDLIVSNDVMEHIPKPERALRECFRILKPGGCVLATFPFHVANDTTVVRAKLVAGTTEHLLAPVYHGNPLSAEGSLVFQDFGWDLFDVMRGVGFAPSCECYCCDEFGHVGAGLLVFRMLKPR